MADIVTVPAGRQPRGEQPGAQTVGGALRPDRSLLAWRPLVTDAALRSLADRNLEPDTLLALRRRAAAVYAALPAPDRVLHLWRYTDPADLLPSALPALDPFRASDVAAPDDALTGGGPEVVVASDGQMRANEAAAESGVQIVPLARGGVEIGRLFQAVPPEHGLFEALNAAAWTAGVLVRLPRRTVLSQPLRVVLPAGEMAQMPRLLIVAESGADGAVVEEHLGGAGGGRVIGVSELFVAPGARLRHVLIQRWGAGVVGHLTTRARVEAGGDLLTVLASLGGALVKLDLGAVLAGEGARSELAGVALGEGRQHFDHHTLHEHRAGHTWSNLDFKVALTGRARSTYTGLIRIEPGAPGSEAYQENRNLLLAEQCRADTIPELEILTDEVVCTHGATVAPLDPEQLFYLESRGISPRQARQVVVRGFLEGTLARIPSGLRPAIEALVNERLAAI